MLAFTLLVFVLWLRLGIVRFSGARRGASSEYIRLGTGPAPPEPVVVIHQHFSNLFEVPVLFYAGCISLFVTRAVDSVALSLAWTFVVARLLHTVIVLTTNRPQQRVVPYVLSCFAVWGLWLLLFLRATWAAAPA